MAKIRLDYERAIAAAGSLARCAEDCRSEARNLKTGLCETLNGMWKGGAASSAQQKLAAISREIETISADINTAAKMIRTTADELKAADEAAAQGVSR